MFSKTILGLSAALLAGANAQTAPGFPIQASEQLIVAYGNNTVSPGGERIPRGETAQPPSITSPVWPADKSGPTQCLLLMVDLDVPSNNSRVQLVHWLATNVTRLNTSSTASLLNIPAAPVPYLQPSPPVGDVPHSYSFVLFPQPANFSIPAQYSDLADNRVGFNVSRFVADAGLGGALAGNWITVQNLTGTATMEFPPARPTATATGNSSTSMPPFEGGATPMRMGGLAGWLGVGTAVFAGVAAFGL